MDERLARIEEKMSLMHEDVKVLKNAHLEAVEFKGSIKGMKWIISAAWAAIIGLGTIVVALFVK